MILDKVTERFGADVLASGTAHGDEWIVVDRERALEILRALRDEPDFQFNFLSDITAVDWDTRTPRFDIVYNLNSLTKNHRLRVKIGVDGKDPWVHSACELWKAADWLEREVFDMFGIAFKGHPDLRRILLYDSFEGHPLRKDYNYQKRQPIVDETNPVLRPLRPSR
jgi:NADH-quinone oxidoreductase subunit C